jgi:dihydrofolate synthase/folylpolyglutamate synthase
VSYEAVLARLVTARRFGVRLGLERMRELLDRLGAPDRRLGTVIHVGGTNGKGSTVAMIAALAASRGRRVATYTSPHLSTLRERITIDGAMVTEDAIVSSAARVSAAGGDELTFFEQITAIAMVIIADAHVDLTVLEVGLGGRLDATNVVDAPVAVVTGVALDHEAILGPTLEAIAGEKAGIWKPGRIAIIGASGEPGAIPTLVGRAREVGAHVIAVDSTAIARVPALSLAGAHQRANAASALAALDALGLDYDPTALQRVTHPGRFERIGNLILDGAHNPHGARALAATLRSLDLRPILIVAISADKDARAIIRELANDVSAIVATRFHQDRSMSPSALAAICREITDVRVSEGDGVSLGTLVRATLRDHELANKNTNDAPTILIAGSLFLVGEARVELLGAPHDPIMVSDPPARG